jgi:hypothetical protein
MRKSHVGLTLIAIVVAFCVGYWPASRGRGAAEQALERAQASLERSEARNRLYGLQSKLVDLLATVEARNFGDAQGKATVFFDAVRNEAPQPDQSPARAALESILAERDAITSALTRDDPATPNLIHGVMTRLREALGEPPSPVPAGTPPALPVTSPS